MAVGEANAIATSAGRSRHGAMHLALTKIQRHVVYFLCDGTPESEELSDLESSFDLLA